MPSAWRAAACRPPKGSCDTKRALVPGLETDDERAELAPVSLTAGHRPLLAVLDDGIGNLRSAQKAFEHLGADARLSAARGLVAEAAGVVLPGVGAFGACMKALHGTGLAEVAL